MNIGSLSSAAYTALNGLGSVIRQVEETAEHVAALPAHPTEGSFVDGLSEIARLPVLEQQARANAIVYSTAEQMLGELARLPRR